MAILKELKKSISEMDNEELFSLVKKIRKSRRVVKKIAKKASKKAKEIDINTILPTLDKSQRKKLLEYLEGRE